MNSRKLSVYIEHEGWVTKLFDEMAKTNGFFNCHSVFFKVIENGSGQFLEKRN